MAKEIIDWRSIVFSEVWLKKLDKLTAHRFEEGGLSEEASTYVLDCLTRNNWQALNAYRGLSKPETFLHTITLNFIEEFSRKRFGRPRPPEWLKRQGEFWIVIWKLICMEKHLSQVVIEKMSNIRNELYIKDVIRTIKARIPWCGESVKEINPSSVLKNESEFTEHSISDQNTPEKVIYEQNHAELLLMLNFLLSTNQTHEDLLYHVANEHDNMSTKFETFSSKISLTDEEQVVLKMVFQDGIKKSIVAKALGMPPHSPGRILKIALKKIETAMIESGFTMNEIIVDAI